MAWELGTFFLLPFLLCGAAALGIFAGVYGLYFGVTYRLFRRSVG